MNSWIDSDEIIYCYCWLPNLNATLIRRKERALSWLNEPASQCNASQSCPFLTRLGWADGARHWHGRWQNHCSKCFITVLVVVIGQDSVTVSVSVSTGNSEGFSRSPSQLNGPDRPTATLPATSRQPFGSLPDSDSNSGFKNRLSSPVIGSFNLLRWRSK